jgi:hypothetical protein
MTRAMSRHVYWLASSALLTIPGEAASQSLDIGGIELRLGQPVQEALRGLSAYQVRYDDRSESWIVTQRGRDPFELLGVLSATQGLVSSISKHYSLNTSYESVAVYSQASREVRRRGGRNCSTREAELATGAIRGFETQCGPYRLVYSLPTTYGTDKVEGGVSLSVSKE